MTLSLLNSDLVNDEKQPVELSMKIISVYWKYHQLKSLHLLEIAMMNLILKKSYSSPSIILQIKNDVNLEKS